MVTKRLVCLGQYYPLKTSFSRQNFMAGLLCGRQYSRHQEDSCKYEKSLTMELPATTTGYSQNTNGRTTKGEGGGDQERGISHHSCKESAQPDWQPRGNGSKNVCPILWPLIILWPSLKKGFLWWWTELEACPAVSGHNARIIYFAQNFCFEHILLHSKQTKMDEIDFY